MARPRKEGLEYFTHDTRSLSDEKLDVLVMQYGARGYAFFFLHLEYIYQRDDLALDVSGPVFRKLICGKLQITPEEYEEILRASLECGLFDEEHFNETGELVNNGVLKRVDAVMKEREGNRNRQQRFQEKHRNNEDITPPSDDATDYNGVITEPNAASQKVTPQKEKEKESIKDSPPSPPRGGGERDGHDDEGEQPERPPGKDTPPCPHERIVALYHEILPQCPKVKTWNGQGRKQLAVRWREDKARQNLDWWRHVFEDVAKSDFLMGRRPNTNFLFSLGWFVGPKNFEKVLNDHYVNHDAPAERGARKIGDDWF